MSKTDEITIRPATSLDDLYQIEAIQQQAWSMSERDIVPAHLLVMLNGNGGLVLGAYRPDGMIVGFVYGLLGKLEDRRAEWMGTPYYHMSEMMGVLPGYRGAGLSLRLKLAQRDYALQQGHRLMTWTFDPLMARNAHLNIERLGCTCRHYIRNKYGELTGINAGLPTDRFAVEWWITSSHVERRLAGADASQPISIWLAQGAHLANPAQPGTAGVPAPGTPDERFDAPALLVEIPADIGAVKRHDLGLAKAWLEQASALFEAAFAAGYVAARFIRHDPERPGRAYHVLLRDMDIRTLAEGTR